MLGTNDRGPRGKVLSGVFESSALESVQLPSTLRVLWSRTFEHCENLKSIRLPNGLRFIGERCFSSTGLAEITVPKSVVMIRRHALNGDELKKVTLEDGSRLRSVGDGAFAVPDGANQGGELDIENMAMPDLLRELERLGKVMLAWE